MAKELETAMAAAEAAGEVLRSGFGRRQSVEYKGEVDLVTEADKQAEEAIKEVLKEAFPDYGMLTEESGEFAGEGDARWVVDPLDGTTNYAHGLPIFATSIALEKEGEVILGVVHDPMGEETYVAERGSGATLNRQRIEVSETDELIRSLLATGFPYDRDDDMVTVLDLFGHFALLTQGMRRLGSAALDLCYVAAGRLDAYYEHGIKAWDIAAGSLIVEEAGGETTDYQGRALDLERAEVVASNRLLHPALVDVINEYYR